MSTTAKRLALAMDRSGFDQSSLARAIGSTQGAVSKILLGKTTNSRLLPKISVVLRVPLDWLLGLSESVDLSEPVAERLDPIVMLPVIMPNVNALARMFEGLLEVVDRSAPMEQLARELAELLPTGLSALRGPLIDGDAARRLDLAAAAVRATAEPEPVR